MPATEVNGLERDFGPFGDDASPAPKYNTIDVIHKPAEAPLVTKAVAILTFGVLAVVGGIAWGMTGGRH